MIIHIKRYFILVMPFLLLTFNVFAQQGSTSLVPLPSTTDYSIKDGWAGAIGLKLQGLAAYKGSDHATLQLVPDGAVQWRKGDHLVFWEGFDLNYTELGWRGRLQETWLLESGIRHEIVIPSGASEKADIDNLPHRGSHVLGFIKTKHALGAVWKTGLQGVFRQALAVMAGWLKYQQGIALVSCLMRLRMSSLIITALSC